MEAGDVGAAVTTGRAGATVEVRDVSKSYVSPAGLVIDALVDVTLGIAAGESVAVMAPSGAGKSTLLHVLGAMDRPDAGNVVINGSDITALARNRLPDYRRSVGFVFQRFHLLAALNALDNVLAPVMPYRTGFDAVERATDLLDQVGLGDRHDAVPAELSGGQQQRVAIARALINKPQLLLADEPTGNLDTATGEAVMGLLGELAAREGMTTVVATHDMGVAANCSRTITLRDGRVVTDSDPR